MKFFVDVIEWINELAEKHDTDARIIIEWINECATPNSRSRRNLMGWVRILMAFGYADLEVDESIKSLAALLDVVTARTKAYVCSCI